MEDDLDAPPEEERVFKEPKEGGDLSYASMFGNILSSGNGARNDRAPAGHPQGHQQGTMADPLAELMAEELERERIGGSAGERGGRAEEGICLLGRIDWFGRVAGADKRGSDALRWVWWVEGCA